ncbi:protein of unknown function [Methylacidimicrobium sp. AP8]|uniref:hypothetical protein n=1 Tax=Methylacidimicrobium sp. AP8 TaxID=2730359 RepID=UPI0018C1489E|nr:hypothetical protein [Methylacidimicrobium sp. AP8]CAB4242796.1 protein of unknown function [Methylacidimicrobium sp. AP8]
MEPLVTIAVVSPASGEEEERLVAEARGQSWARKEILVAGPGRARRSPEARAGGGFRWAAGRIPGRRWSGRPGGVDPVAAGGRAALPLQDRGAAPGRGEA